MDEEASLSSVVCEDGRLGEVRPRDSVLECRVDFDQSPWCHICFPERGAELTQNDVESSERDKNFSFQDVTRRGGCDEGVEA